MISTNGRQGDGFLELANSGRVKGVEVSSAFNDTGVNSPTCTHIHANTHTTTHSCCLTHTCTLTSIVQ